MFPTLLRMRQACISWQQAIEAACSVPREAAIAPVSSSTATRLYLQMHPTCCNEHLISSRPVGHVVRQFSVRRGRKKVALVQPKLDITRRVNEQIEAEKVLVVGEGESEVLSLADAIKMAKAKQMQLVEVDRQEAMPICRVMLFGKWMEKSKTMHDAVFTARKESVEAASKIKGLRMGCDIPLPSLDARPPGRWPIPIMVILTLQQLLQESRNTTTVLYTSRTLAQ